ncbi:DUF1642 domain-containing protein [Lacticaseibacillus paracasei]|uniref:Phage protein n=1 Tax=Lacticaseibacillus paracasei subsp. paracasei Lpp7 TaxID=1256200 RepID=A0A8E0M9C5_LACPA|nr:DUF1642 domain-containing protein [Lacticaseibacillus paracasei]EPC51921.1 phage protein [Lacticaseibacillus paracasei subsp. paracasei Lpp7]
MSEEKLYAVKNDEGEWSDDSGAFYPEKKNGMGFIFTMFSDRDEATGWAERNTNGGHVVTLIEEPEKVVLSEKQAEIVEKARVNDIPATYISARTDEYNGEESLLINAYVNGYTVAKEKKYNVKVPHTKEAWYYQSGDTDLLTICPADKELRGKFTESEIEHYGLQDCEKEEVTDDDD